MLFVTLGLSLASVAFSAEIVPSGIVPPHSLVRVKLLAGERVWVLASSFEPVDVQACTAENLLIWTGQPGRYVVLSWTADSQSQTVVTIGQPDPPPPPPDPDPPPPPPPTPDKVPNQFGLGLPSYQAAKRIGKAEEAARFALQLHKIARELGEQRLTAIQAEAAARTFRLALSTSWSQWEQAIEPALKRALQEHGSGALAYRDFFYELARGLEESTK